MKSNYRLRLLPLAAFLAAAGAAADPSAGQGSAAPAQAPDSNVAGAEAPKKRAPKDPNNLLDIINGRMPMPLVFLIRFKTDGQSNGEVAKAYGTSVGKVFDIRKNANFAYIDKDYKPSADEVAAAKKWLNELKTHTGKTLAEAGGKPTEIGALLDAMGVATADEVAKRGWVTRVVGQKAAAGTAPVAGAPAASAAAPAADGATGKAKLF